MSKDLIIVRGCPGSGKSTLSKLFNTIAICSADDYHIDRDGNYNWNPDNLFKSHMWCQKKCRLYMEYGMDKIIIDNTSTTEKELKPYLELAENYGYRVFSIIVENRRNGKSVHGVPDETVEKMKERFSIKL